MLVGGLGALRSSNMTIMNVSLDYDRAWFQCVAGNRLGLSYSNVRLVVRINNPGSGGKLLVQLLLFGLLVIDC